MCAADTRDLICVGAIAGAFGVRGELRLKSFCAVPENIAAYGPLYSCDGKQSFEVRVSGTAKNSLLVRLAGVDSREQAEALRGTRLYMRRNRLPQTGRDEFYHVDIIGLKVVDRDGLATGTIKAVENFGAGDLIEVESEDGSTELVPFTKSAVPFIDISRGLAVVDWSAGMTEGGSEPQ